MGTLAALRGLVICEKQEAIGPAIRFEAQGQVNGYA